MKTEHLLFLATGSWQYIISLLKSSLGIKFLQMFTVTRGTNSKII